MKKKYTLLSILLLVILTFNPSYGMQDIATSQSSNDTTLVTQTTGENTASSIEESKTTNVVDKKQIQFKRQPITLTRILRGMLGMLTLQLIEWVFGISRSAISWKVVGIGLLIQITLAVSILYFPYVTVFFETVGKIFVKILDFTNEGTKFLFKSFGTGEIESPLLNFAVTILPTVIFFAALTSVLFYYGIIQKVVYVLAWLMTKAFRLSGAESLSVAGNIFLGQTESPLMIKAYLEKMNKSEIMLVMAGGMATLAGGVLAVYIRVLGGTDNLLRLEYAKHLLGRNK